MASPPTLLFINRVYPPARGASARVLRDLAQAFAREGWKVTVLCAGNRATVFKDHDVTVQRISTTSRKTAFGFLRVWCALLYAALKLPRHDVVVTLTDPPLLVVAGRIVARSKKSSHLHWCQDVYPDLAPLVGLNVPKFLMNYLQRLSRRSMTSCDRVVAVGRCMAKHLTQTGVQSSRLTVIPNWPQGHGYTQPLRPLNTIIKPPANDSESVELLKDTSPKFRILYTGTLSRVHPVSTILEAATILQNRHTDIEFVFVGEGPVYEKIAAERTRLGLENVRLLPPQPDEKMNEFLLSGDVHLISLKDEAAGMIVPSRMYAAFAAQRPCILIGPENSESANVINEFQAGCVVPQGRGDVLANAIALYRNDSSAWYTAHEGSKRAGEIYKQDQAIQTWIMRVRETLKNAA